MHSNGTMLQGPSRFRTLIAGLGLIVALLVPAVPAHAAEAYEIHGALNCGGHARGTMDRNYNLYLNCGNHVRIVRPDGSSTNVPLTGGGSRQLAPSPDGTILYGVWGDMIGNGELNRYRLQNGSYVYDPAWKPRTAQGGKVCGRGVTTDAYGFIYVANGGWCSGAGNNQVIKFRPDGSVVTGFGEFAQTGEPGTWNVDMDVAVTSDGRRIYVADHLNTRVQYFEWQWNGSYAYGGEWHVPSATYDVKLDPWGYVYATSTTQADILKYSATGALAGTVANEAGAGTPSNFRIHAISVDARGWVYSGEMQRIYRRTAGNPVPGPLPAHQPMPLTDTRIPVVTSLTAPTETIESSVPIGVAASDPDGNAIVAMRLADESGDWGQWRGFATALDVPLTDGVGYKAIYIQVRDASGKESDARSVAIQRRPIPDVADPLVTLRAPATSTTATVSLAIESSDDIGVTHLRIAGEDGEFSEWRPWSSGLATFAHTLTAGYGTRIVAIQVRDAAFRVSATAQAAIVVAAPVPQAQAQPVHDVPAGGGVPVVVRDGIAPRILVLRMPARSCSRRIVLRMRARDDRRVTHVRVANENGRFGGWRRWSPTVVHTLSRGSGRKAVYVQVRDAAGNVSRASARRTLVVKCVRRR